MILSYVLQDFKIICRIVYIEKLHNSACKMSRMRSGSMK